MPRNDFVNVDGTINYNNITSKPDFDAHKAQLYFNVKSAPYNAVGNGVVDDTLAIQTAIDDAFNAGGGVVYFPKGIYGIRTPGLKLKRYVVLKGSPSAPFGDGMHSNLKALDACNIIEIPYVGGDYVVADCKIENLKLINGTNGIYMPDGAVNFMMESIKIAGPSNACIYARGFLQEIFSQNLDLSGGQYGIYYTENGVNTAANKVWFDKSSFINNYIHGQSKNALCILADQASNVNWFRTTIVNIKEHGVRLKNGSGWAVIGVDTENGAGHTNGAKETTGSIDAATKIVTVADITGFAVDQTCCMGHAGANGGELISVITGIDTVNKKITLTDNASFTVSGVYVTNSLYSIMNIEGSFFNASFVDCMFNQGIEGKERHSVVGGTQMTFTGCSANRIADYSGNNTVIGGSANQVRAYPRTNFHHDYEFTTSGYRTVIPSPAGKDIQFMLMDSKKDTTGTFGDIWIMKHNSGRDWLLVIPGSEGSTIQAKYKIQTWKGISPGKPGSQEVNQTIYYDTTTPTAGTFNRGDIIFNMDAAAGGKVGWVCTAGGTSGTWKAFGAIDA